MSGPIVLFGDVSWQTPWVSALARAFENKVRGRGGVGPEEGGRGGGGERSVAGPSKSKQSS